MKVFVTVGTTSFDALIRTIDTESFHRTLQAKGVTQIKLQIGRGIYIPKITRIPMTFYRFDPEYKQDVMEADWVISHAGSGSIMDALGLKKKLLVVINTSLMDNHQLELAQALASQKYLLSTFCPKLQETIELAEFDTLRPYPPIDYTLFPALVNAEMGVIGG